MGRSFANKITTLLLTLCLLFSTVSPVLATDNDVVLDEGLEITTTDDGTSKVEDEIVKECNTIDCSLEKDHNGDCEVIEKSNEVVDNALIGDEVLLPIATTDVVTAVDKSQAQVSAVANTDVDIADYAWSAAGVLTVKTDAGTTSWESHVTDKNLVKNVIITDGVKIIGNDAFAEVSSDAKYYVPYGSDLEAWKAKLADSGVIITATNLLFDDYVAITTDLSSDEVIYEANSTNNELVIEAGTSDSFALSYHWYSSATAETDGIAIKGATSASFTPSTDVGGSTYYYCIVTSTKNVGTTTKVISATSKLAKVSVKAPATIVTDSTSFLAAINNHAVTTIQIEGNVELYKNVFTTEKDIIIPNGTSLKLITSGAGNIVIEEGGTLFLRAESSTCKLEGTLVNNGLIHANRYSIFGFDITSIFTNNGDIKVDSEASLIYGDVCIVTDQISLRDAIANESVNTIQTYGDVSANAFTTEKDIIIPTKTSLRLADNSTGNITVDEGGTLKLYNKSITLNTLNGKLTNNGKVEMTGKNNKEFLIQSEFVNNGTVTVAENSGLGYDYGKLSGSGITPPLGERFFCNVSKSTANNPSVSYSTSTTVVDQNIETGDTVYLTFEGFLEGITRENIGNILNTTWQSGEYGAFSNDEFSWIATSEHVGETYIINNSLKTGYKMAVTNRLGEYFVGQRIATNEVTQKQYNKVYLGGNTGADTNNGATLENPLASLEAAYDAVAENGEIILVGNAKLAKADNTSITQDKMLQKGNLKIKTIDNLLYNITMNHSSDMYTADFRIPANSTLTMENLTFVAGTNATSVNMTGKISSNLNLVNTTIAIKEFDNYYVEPSTLDNVILNKSNVTMGANRPISANNLNLNNGSKLSGVFKVKSLKSEGNASTIVYTNDYSSDVETITTVNPIIVDLVNQTPDKFSYNSAVDGKFIAGTQAHATELLKHFVINESHVEDGAGFYKMAALDEIEYVTAAVGMYIKYYSTVSGNGAILTNNFKKPVKNEIPETSFKYTQIIGAITWSDSPEKFLANTVYTATIKLTARHGYTLDGANENTFSYAGATSVKYDVNTETVTIVFAATDERVLENIEITTQPDKTEYEAFEVFDTKGMVVQANYDDETNEVITNYTYKHGNYDTKYLVVAHKIVAIIYEDKSVNVGVTVTQATPILTLVKMVDREYSGLAIDNPVIDEVTIEISEHADIIFDDVSFLYSESQDMSKPTITKPTNAGTYYIQASVDEKYNTHDSTSEVVSFNITQAPLTISGGTVTTKEYDTTTDVNVTNLTFDGLKNRESLDINTDYTVGTPNFDDYNVGTNINVTGSASLVETSVKANNYALDGTFLDVTGEITVKDFTPTIEKIEAETYTGEAIEPVLVVKDGNTTLVLDTDYTIAYANNINVGTAVATITLINNYSGKKTSEFTITAKEITPTVTVSEKYIFTGEAIKPDANVLVKDVDTRLVLDTDYTVAYTNNINAGTAVATVTLINNYGGETDAEFLINKAAAPDKINEEVLIIKNVTDEQIFDLSNVILPIDKGNTTFEYVSLVDDNKIINSTPTVNANVLKYLLTGDGMVGNVANIKVKAIMENYDDATIILRVKLKDKDAQLAPDSFILQIAKNGNAFTATIPSVLNGEYSFDGINFSDNNQKSGIAYNISVTGYVRVKESSTHYASHITSNIQTTPKLPTIIPEDDSSNNDSSNDLSYKINDVVVSVDDEVEDGNEVVYISDDEINDAIEKAKSNKTNSNEICITLNLTTINQNVEKVTVNLPKTLQDKIINNEITSTKIVINNPEVHFVIDLEAMKNITKQANGDVHISYTRLDNEKIETNVEEVIGNRPAFDFEITYGKDKKITDLKDDSLSIFIPYELKENETAANVIGVFVDNDETVSYLEKSSYDEERELLIFSVNHFSTYAVGYKEVVKVADISNHWAKESIEFALNRDLFNEIEDGKFSPDMSMTKGMIVTALGRIVDLDTKKYQLNNFEDVQVDDYFMPYAIWASENKIVTNETDAKFCANSEITREQMAVILYNYADVIGFVLPQVHKENNFDDAKEISSWAKNEVKAMQMAGILSGKDSNKLDPQAITTRAEAFVMINRFIELFIDSETAIGWMVNDEGNWKYYDDGEKLIGKHTIDGVEYSFDNYGEINRAAKNNSQLTPNPQISETPDSENVVETGDSLMLGIPLLIIVLFTITGVVFIILKKRKYD